MRRVCLLSFAILSLWVPAIHAQKISGQLFSAPLLPQVVPSATYPPDTGYTLTAVSSGANLQTAITAAACGTKLNLAHDGTFTAGATPYTLPNNSCACHTDPTKYIIIQSDAFEANYVSGVRLDPSTQYHNLAHISGSDTNYTFTAITNGASCWGFAGLDITNTFDGANAVLALGDGSLTVANYPHDFSVWGSYIHGQSTKALVRCVLFNGTWGTFIDSYFSDCHKVGQDTQCFESWDGLGAVLMQNNFCEGAGENVLIGGADPQVGTLSCDFTFQKNHFFKPLSWRAGSSSYVGIHWGIKNLFEFKDICRALITANVFENNWGDAQNGVAFPFDSCNQSGTNKTGTIQDVTMYLNVLRHSAGVGNIAGCSGSPHFMSDHRMWFHDNLYWDIDQCLWASCSTGRSWLFGPIEPGSVFAPFDIWWDHETVSTANQTAGIAFGGTAGVDFSYGIQFTNSIISNNQVSGAIVGTAIAPGNAVVTNFAPGAKFNNDCLIGDNSAFYTFSNFSGKQFPASEALVYVATGVDFHVSASSVCHNAASNGADMGANIDAVNAATTGVVQTLGNLHTVTNVSPSTFTHLGSTSITITGTNFISGEAQVIIGGAGPAVAETSNSCGFGSPGQFTVTVSTDTTHFTYTGGCAVVTSAPITLAVNDTINITVNSAQTTGTVNRYTPGNLCTSLSVVNSTTITCVTPAATGVVTNGPVSLFVSQWGIPVQSTVYGLYN